MQNIAAVIERQGGGCARSGVHCGHSGQALQMGAWEGTVRARSVGQARFLMGAPEKTDVRTGGGSNWTCCSRDRRGRDRRTGEISKDVEGRRTRSDGESSGRSGRSVCVPDGRRERRNGPLQERAAGASCSCAWTAVRACRWGRCTSYRRRGCATGATTSCATCGRSPPAA
mgnify:CR=1 FL=1